MALFDFKQIPDCSVIAWIAAQPIAGLGGVGDDPACTQDGVSLLDEFAVQG